MPARARSAEFVNPRPPPHNGPFPGSNPPFPPPLRPLGTAMGIRLTQPLAPTAPGLGQTAFFGRPPSPLVALATQENTIVGCVFQPPPNPPPTPPLGKDWRSIVEDAGPPAVANGPTNNYFGFNTTARGINAPGEFPPAGQNVNGSWRIP